MFVFSQPKRRYQSQMSPKRIPNELDFFSLGAIFQLHPPLQDSGLLWDEPSMIVPTARAGTPSTVFGQVVFLISRLLYSIERGV